MRATQLRMLHRATLNGGNGAGPGPASFGQQDRKDAAVAAVSALLSMDLYRLTGMSSRALYSAELSFGRKGTVMTDAAAPELQCRRGQRYARIARALRRR